ncbi:hypothetical protein CPS_2801 [Colwellia psychrerythraea 34H]|uniref:Uncharacterized protein n=1 Tax=Colwellia psychrerythraea (strain 34H / ATCC BAA-681) TaxID=167879 RepID=Q480K6_COLP3|nr:hypothetical protein CPS_2801 [Colwellia psychrerythraea 34H]
MAKINLRQCFSDVYFGDTGWQFKLNNINSRKATENLAKS